MQLKIVKKSEYSSGKWRLVDRDNNDIYLPKKLELQSGTTYASMPVCSDTKEGLISEILALVVSMSEKIKSMSKA